MAEGTSLDRLCLIDQNITELKKSIKNTFEVEFSQEEIESRKILLEREYDNEVSFRKIIEAINS